jgi:hypothetical protein
MPVTYTCPVCRTTSFNKNDVTNLYCGRCHAFEADLPQRMQALAEGLATLIGPEGFHAVVEDLRIHDPHQASLLLNGLGGGT